jgi:hypothetical protein
MTKRIRVALVGAVGLLALAFAGSALAAFSPKLTVTHAAQGVTVDVRVNQTDDPTAKVSIYVPNGYQLNSPSPGTKLGDVKATAQAADLGGAVLPLTGELQTVDPKTFTTSTGTPYAAAQAACGVPTVAAGWNLHLTAAGQVLDVPVFVVQNSSPEAAAGPYKLVVCLPPPDVPAGTPGRATFGAKLLSATFTSSALTPPSSAGEYRWTSAWTPYTPNTGKPNPAGSVEVQSLVRLPTQVGLTVRKTRVFKNVKVKGKTVKQLWTRVSVIARVSENAQPVGGIRVTMTVNGKRLGAAATDTKNGAVTGTFLLRKGTVTVAASGAIPTRDLGAAGCTKTAIFAGIPCNDATVGGVTVRATAKVAALKK